MPAYYHVNVNTARGATRDQSRCLSRWQWVNQSWRVIEGLRRQPDASSDWAVLASLMPSPAHTSAAEIRQVDDAFEIVENGETRATSPPSTPSLPRMKSYLGQAGSLLQSRLTRPDEGGGNSIRFPTVLQSLRPTREQCSRSLSLAAWL
jgi:hypothetical protein